MSHPTGIPVLKSAFLTDLRDNAIGVNSDSDSDEEPLRDSSAFVVDTKPQNEGRSKASKLVKKEKMYSSQLKTTMDTSGYFDDSRPLDSMNKLNAMSVNAILREKCVITPSAGKESSAFYRESKRERKRRIKREREKTTGEKWFNLPATEMTEEKKRDLLIVKMRDVLDPKRFYKKSEWKQELPKYFQVGTVVDNPVDFYRDRLPRKERKATLVDELMADAEFQRWNKKKYAEAMKNNPYYLKIARRKQKRKQKANADNSSDSKPKRYKKDSKSKGTKS